MSDDIKRYRQLIESVTCGLQEAKFSEPTLAYHGTSADKIPSILSNGLLAGAAGSGYGSGINKGDEHKRDMKAIGGVYFATAILKANSAASQIASRNKSNKVIITASLQLRSAYEDEDNLDMDITRALSSSSEITDIMNYVFVKWSSTPERKKIIDDFIGRFPLLKHQPAKNISSFIETFYERKLSYLTDKSFYRPYFMRAASHVFGSRGDEALRHYEQVLKNIPEPSEAEANYKNKLDWITRALKRLAYDTKENPRAGKGGVFGSSFRIPTDVKYSGNNKIVSIVEVDDENKQLIIRYGSVVYAEAITRDQNFEGYTIA